MFLATITNLFTAIGWALLNSIWQMGLLYLLAGFTTKFIFKSAAARHTAFTAALITGFSWFVFNLFTTPRLILNLSASNYQFVSGWKVVVALINNALPYITILYISWVSISLLRLAYTYTANLNQQKANWQKLPAQWRLFIQQQAQRLGIKKSITAFVSNYIDTPQVIGILKPVILIPASCITYLSPQQLEAVLLHEIAHIKRNDFALNVFIIVVEILFFFNPFAHKLTNGIRKEREYSCDDWVLQFQYQP
ncbi:MAG: M56 family metallopeptidase, partial [Flavihumibacter sp.]|nr:M56 family metallopeptidase [Flavihumibacter sp.]